MRDFFKRDEGKLSVLQIIGFCLLVIGVIGIGVSSFIGKEPIIPSVVAVSFFVTMLGFAFAFPSLLEANEGLSTMRIIVFMMTNVICMLLLKIGWADGIDSLGKIGLDGYWMGVIAFVFGAKATQSFFESRLAAPNLIAKEKNNSSDTKTETDKTTGGDINTDADTKKTIDSITDISKEEIIKQAIKQFSIRHLDGVTGVGRGFKESGNGKEPCLQINVDDEKYVKAYEKPLEVDLGNDKKQTIIPKVVFVGESQTHSGRGGEGIMNIGGINGTGTIGCVVLDNDTNKRHILSCQHVLSHDIMYNRISDPAFIALAENPAVTVAKHVSGMRTNEIDAGLAEILTQQELFNNTNLGIIKGTRDVTIADINETVRVKLTGYDVGLKKINKVIGVIVNNEFFAKLKYADGNKFGLEDLIVLSKKEGTVDTPVSKPGYSGSLVIDENNFAIGLLVGGDGSFSYAIPIKKILTALNCSILKS